MPRVVIDAHVECSLAMRNPKWMLFDELRVQSCWKSASSRIVPARRTADFCCAFGRQWSSRDVCNRHMTPLFKVVGQLPTTRLGQSLKEKGDGNVLVFWR